MATFCGSRKKKKIISLYKVLSKEVKKKETVSFVIKLLIKYTKCLIVNAMEFQRITEIVTAIITVIIIIR